MANKRFYQFLYSKQPKLTMINGVITFGASGAVSAASGPGVQGVTRLTTGIYQIKLVDNYVAFVGFDADMLGGVTGSNVASGSLVTGTLYQITAVGTTVWSSAGLDADYTAAVGSVFVATGTAAGTGTAKAVAASGIATVEPAQSVSALLQSNATALGRGSSLIVQTFDVSDALANPVSGSQMTFKIWLKDSSALAF